MTDFDRGLHQVRRGVAPRIVHGCSRRGLLSTTALQAVAVVAVLAMTQQMADAQLSPSAHPTGGQVVAGQAAIAQTANTTTVTQTSAKAAVNWQSYNVGSAQTVQYVDPSSSSVTLNRVVGANPSEIAGRIISNGTVMIVNQAGLLFDGSAQINTAGLVVSAAGISNNNFMAGKMVFDQAANPGAKIENRGTITIKNQGLAALVAPQVVNSGVIRAKLGTVILAGAEAETLDLYGDGMVSINVTKQVATAPNGTQALVTNTGAISASGGTVLLTAQAVDGVVQTLVDAGGKISANSVGSRTGRVVIAGAGGDVEVSGAVTADGHAPGTTGGSVVVNTTGAVRLASTARISASGPAGGGVVAIGTTLKRAKGGPSVTGQKTAKTVTVAAGATIAANATAKGNGGRVTVLSTGQTTMAGEVDAKGGSQGGDGGFVELSGGVLSLTGLVNASAPLGKTGTLLLDPSDLYISDAEPSSATAIPSPGSSIVVNSGTISWVSPAELQALSANITLSAAHDIFFASGTAGANTLNLGSLTLAASAGNDLTIDRGFTINAGAISLIGSAGAITLGGSSGVGAGLINLAELGALGATTLQGPSGSSVTMVAGTGIQLADAVIGSSAAPLATLSLSTSGGGVTQAAGGVISAGTLMSGGTLVGSVGLAGTANAIASIGSVALASGGFSLTDGVSLNVGTLTASTSATILDAGTLLVSGTIAPSGAGPIGVSLTAGNLNLAGVVSDGGTGTTTLIATQGSIMQTGGNLLTGMLAGSAVTSASLIQPTNLVGTLGAFATGAGFALTDNQSLLVSGPVTDIGISSTLALTTTTGGLTLGGTVGAVNVLDMVSAGSITQTGGSISAAFLTGSAVGRAGLTQLTNIVGTLGAFATGAGFALTDNQALAVVGPVTDTGASSTLALTTRTGDLTLAGSVSATNVLDLVSAGSIVQNGGSIIAGNLTGSAVASASLIQPTNLVGTLGAFTTGAGFALTNNQALSVNGPVTDTGASSAVALTTRTGDLTLAGAVSATNVLDLVSAGSIVQNGGSISAGSLTGSAVASVSLMRPTNLVGTLGAFATGAGFAFTNNQALSVNGPVTDTGLSSVVALTTKTGDLILAGNVSATNGIDLVSAGSIIQNGGSISAGNLTGSAVASASLAQLTNLVGTLGAFATGAGLSLTDNQALSVNGPVTDTGASSTLALTTRTGDLTLAGNVSATHVIDLVSAGSIVQNGGSISAASLTGSAVTPANLAQPTNLVGTLGAFATGAGFAFTNNQALLVNGPVTDTGVSSTLALTTKTGGLTLAGTVTAKNVLDLVSAGSITQTGGSINAATLMGSAVTSASLTQPANLVGALGAFATGAGFALTDNQALLVNGPVTDTGLSSTLALTTKIGDLTLAGNVSATNVLDLVSAGMISQTGGSISAGSLTGSAVTSAGLTQPTNLVGTLGAFATTAGFALTDNEALTVNGSVSDTGSSSALDLTTTTGGITLAGNVNASNALNLVSAGSISQSGGSITANTLTVTTTAPGNVALTGNTNQIAASNGIAVNQGNLFLVDDRNLTLSGVFSADEIFFEINAPGAGLQIGSNSVGANLATSGSPISLVADLITEGSAASTIGAPGGIVQLAPFSIGRDVSLAGSAGNHLLIDSTLLGDITAASLYAGQYFDRPNGGALRVSAGNISIDGAVDPTGVAGTLGLFGSGAITETTGMVTILSLVGSGSSISLLAPGNHIAALAGSGGNLTATSGNLSITNGTSLNVFGTITAFGNMYIQTPSATGVDFGASGSVIAGGLASFLTDRFNQSGLGTVFAPTFELAPSTMGATEVVGGAGSALASLSGINAGNVRIGAVTEPVAGFTTTAGSISVASSFGAGSTNLELDSLGGIGQATGAVLTAGTLTGHAGADVVLTQANAIGNLGSFMANGALALADGGQAGALVVSGPVTGTNVTITGAPTIDVTGSIDATLLTLSSGLGGIGLESGDYLSAGTVDISTLGGGLTQVSGGTVLATLMTSSGGIAGAASLLGTANQIGTISGLTAGGGLTVVDNEALTLAGLVSAGAGGAMDLSTLAGGLTQGASGTLVAGTLTSSLGIAGAAILQGTANRIGTISGLTAIGTLTVVDSLALALAGSVSAGGAGTMDISTLSGGLTQGPSGTLVAGTLTSSGGIAGSAILQGTANQIGTITGLTPAGALTIVDDRGLTLAGLVGTGTVDVTTLSGGLTQGPTGTLLAGVLTSSGGIAGTATLSGIANQIGTIGGLTAGGALTVVDDRALTLAGVVGAGHAGTMDITTLSGGLTQGAAGTLVAGILTSSGGIAGPATLLGTANQIGSIAGLTSVGTLTVVDGEGLSLAGIVSAGNAGTVDVTTLAGGLTQGASGTLIAGVLTSTGGIAGPAILQGTANQIGSVTGLTAGGTLTVVDSQALALAGVVSAGTTGSVDLTTRSGGLTQGAAGTLIAGTLTSSGGIAGPATLLGTANQIGSIARLTSVGTLTVVDGEGLSLAGIVSAGNAGTFDVTTLAGGLTQGASGTLIAGVLTSTGGIAGPAILQGTANQIGTVTGLTAGGTLTVVDSQALALAGVVSAGNAGLMDLTTRSGGLTQGASGTLIAGILTSSGGIAGPAILLGTANQIGTVSGLTAGGTLTVVDHQALALAGVVSAGPTGSVDLSTSLGGLTQGPAGTLIAGTLTSSGGIAGPAVLQGTANQIGTISGLTSGGALTVVDDRGLTLAGLVGAGGGTGTVDVTTLSGGLTQGPSGTLLAGVLTSSGGIAGPAVLTGTANQIGSVSGLTAGGALTVVDGTALTLSGLVSAGHSGTMDITTLSGGLTQGAAGTLVAGILTSSGGIAGPAILQGTANQIGTISGLTAGGTLTVVDDQALALAGVVSAGNAGTMDLTTLSGGLTQGPSGMLIAGTLASTGGIAGPAILQGTANQIGTVSGLTAGGGLTVVDSQALALAGVVSAGSAGTMDLTTLSGGLTQSAAGTLIAGVLTSSGGIAGPAILQGTANQIGSVSGLTAGGALTVVDNGPLSLAGLVSAGNAGVIDVTTLSGGLTQGAAGTLIAGTLTSTGGIAGPAILQGTANQIGSVSGLTAGGMLTVVDNQALTLTGLVSAGNAGTMDLTTLSGGLTQGAAGTLIAGTLTSTGGIAGPATLQGMANQIGSVSDLTAGGALIVVDNQALVLAGVVSAGSAGTMDLTTRSGGLTQAASGTLIAGTLTSSQGIAGPAALQGTANQIGTISDLTAGGALTVVDSKALTLAGLVSAGAAGSVDITTLSGGLTQGPSATLVAGMLTSSEGIAGPAVLQGTANQIGTISGLTAGGALTVVDSEALGLAGLVSVSTGGVVDITVASGGLSQGTGGTLVAGTLLSSGGVTGSVSLLGTNNQIANLGSAAGVPGALRATGDIAINDAIDLGIPGDVVAGNGTAASPNASLSIALPAGRTLTINGEAIAASPAGGVTVTAGNIVIAQAGAVPPLVEANGPVILSSFGALSQTAGAIAGSSVTLGAPGNAGFSNGTIVATNGSVGVTAPLSTVSAGAIIAALGAAPGISFSGSVTQSAASYIGSNGPVSVGSLLTENGGILLAVGNVGLGALSQSGGTIAAGGGLSIGQGNGVAGWSGSSATAGGFSQSGGLLAATNDANIFTTGAFTQTGGMVATGGTLGVTANNGIVVDGIVSAAGPSTGFMMLANSGDAVLGTTGLLAGPALNPSAGAITGNALQAPAGMVQIAGPSGTQGFARAGGVGGIAAVTGYQIAPPATPPGVPMLSAPAVGGPALAPIPVQLTGSTIDIERSLTASTLGLYAGTTITEGPSGLINAGTLTGSANADIALNTNNVIGTLGSFNDAGHGFWLVDASNLMLDGLLSANSIRIEDVGFEIDLTAGSAFAGVGAGSTNPLKADAFPAPGSPGIYLLASNFVVVENPIVSTGSVIDWTFALPATATGNVGLGDFQQPKVKLFLSLGAGTASGQVNIAGLQVTYAKATTMTVHLTGTISGISGQTAASGTHISPLPSNNYQINGCPISSVNCIKFTGLTVPVTNPLQDVEFGDMLSLSDIDIMLPDVAERDY